MKRKSRKQSRAARDRALKTTVVLIGALLVALVGWRLWSGNARAGGTVDIPHLHGLGFSADGEQLIVPAHDGLRIYSNGVWQEPDLPAHDYMGYSPTDFGFYSSGHPAPGSGLNNPLGLVKSADGGQTLTQLGFDGESDFHLMGVGYFNHAIYVFSPSPNSRLAAGMSYSLDDGHTWQQSSLSGIAANPYQIAVHPTEPGIVALATQAGLFLSIDFGDTSALISPGPVTATAFAPDGKSLLFGALSLFSYGLESGQIATLPSPALAGDNAITNIAVNPARPGEIALATSEIDVYLSPDGGATWRQIAENGKGGK
ncbi:MAG TPA: hypothetical protein VMN57_03570 [Anaerolineales bacterium]|nr:hypothetical protein [Anaerolineales bacterium]